MRSALPGIWTTEWTQHEGQRGAELVGHVGEEGRLSAVDLSKCLCAFARRFVCSRVGRCAGDVRRYELEERPVLGVDGAAWTEAHNQQTRELILRRVDGQDERVSHVL
jgi:hypothetical protein